MLRLAFYILTLFELLLLLAPIATTNSQNSPASNNDIPSSSQRHKETESSTSETSSPAAFIISTVDGVLYTLDAYHGTLRGMFQSGPALVSQSTSDDFPNEDNNDDEDIDIIPGLDGSLYSYQSHELHQLPMRVQDLITGGPISTCFDSTCAGVVMGQSTKKLIAVDPISGTVKWIHEADLHGHGFQSERHSESKHRDEDTTNDGKGNKTVLLQREDYNVKHVDIHTGTESWAVHLGSIQALDLGRRTSDDTSKHRGDQERHGHHENGRIPGFDIHSNLLPGKEIDENRNIKDAHENHHVEFSLFESIHPGPFPSIAFGEDGTTVFGIDSATNNVVWRKRFESVVASVYGVDSDANWIDLTVLDIDTLDDEMNDEHDYEFLPSISSESEDDLGTILSNRQRNHGHFISEYSLDTSSSNKLISLPLATTPSSTMMSNDIHNLLLTHSESLVPGSSVGLELTTCDDEVQLTKIGIEGSAIFVAPPKRHSSSYSSMTNKLRIGAPNRPLSLPSKESDLDWNSHLHSGEKLSLPSSEFFEENGLGEYEDFAKIYARLLSLNMSHKTEHGLFLTWKMVVLLGLSLMVGIAGGRFFYLKKKRTWIENSPAVLSLPNNSQLHHTPLQRPHLHLGGEMQALNLGEASVSGTQSDNFKKKIHTPLNGNSTIPRSASLPQLNKFLSGSIEDISISPSASLSKRGRSNTDDMESLIPTVAGTNPSMTATLNNASSVSNQTQTKASSETTSLAIGGVSTIDGIPFYRYTRYQSEFQEKMQLGEGGFGTVFKCINTLDKREYAVKKVLLRSGVGSNGHLPEQFTQKLHRVLREVKILALLDHPNIVRYCTAWLELELSEDDGESPTKAKSFSRGFSSEYLVGSTLGGESLSPTRGSSKNHLHRSIFEARDTKENPLQWNDFSFLDSDQLDISTQRKLEARESSSSLLSGSDDDIGFSWERSPIASSRHQTHIKKSDGLTTIEDSSINLSEDESNSSTSNSGSSSSNGSDVDSNTNWSDCDSNVVTLPSEEKTDSSYQQNKGNPGEQRTHKKTHKYVLYIQMQLCLKTLQDYMRSRGDTIDIPSALRLFSQIARGMQFVHEKGLIHRDLKPANCFMDDANCVKIGDFGLSRESGDLDMDNLNSKVQQQQDLSINYDNTVGVGTMNYASPEQINGSDYDSSSDIYSLGIILFELCHPMYTGMERFKAFEGIRKGLFPAEWHTRVANEFPDVHSLLVSMISTNPSDRPSASQVVSRIEALVNEHTVSSLDTTSKSDESVFIRVEATCSEGVLARTMSIINETELVNIVQYSLRVNENKAIMEFALIILDCSTFEASLEFVFDSLRKNDEITVVRRIFSSSAPADDSKQRTLSK